MAGEKLIYRFFRIQMVVYLIVTITVKSDEVQNDVEIVLNMVCSNSAECE